jgi:hypothetical protein
MKKFLQFKIDLKHSKIPKLIKVPKTKYEAPEGKFENFINERHIKFNTSKFLIEYDDEAKTLRPCDNLSRSIHGIYNLTDINGLYDQKDKMYCIKTQNYFRFPLYHNMILDHSIFFDPAKLDKKFCFFRNYVDYFFQKDKNDKKSKIKFYDRTVVELKLLKVYDSVMDAISPALKKKCIGKKVINESIKILKSTPKKSREFFSRRAAKYEKIFSSNEVYDVIKIAKVINNLMYDYRNRSADNPNYSLMVFLVQFVRQYSIWYKLNVTTDRKLSHIHEVLEILNIDPKDKEFLSFYQKHASNI